ncbi:cell division protein FtsL [Salinibius halmophilus]|uniref:cell division protein FtsL n=1 Tax=Salinibius halmophilus TaxID=1853216 RepID=UPI000E66AD40|nr:cell division protein FtsL [Salinibius halmophilus]
MRHRWLLTTVLSFACAATAIAIVKTSYETRQLYAQLQTLRQEAQQMQSQYGQLLLEQTALQNLGRVERIAVQEWDMGLPEADAIIIWRE